MYFPDVFSDVDHRFMFCFVFSFLYLFGEISAHVLCYLSFYYCIIKMFILISDVRSMAELGERAELPWDRVAI